MKFSHFVFAFFSWYSLSFHPTLTARPPFPDIEIPNLTTDMKYLADPARQGRGIGLPGNTDAVQYIQNQMRKMNLSELEKNSEYLQNFSIFTHLEKTGENSLYSNFDTSFTEFEPISFSDSNSVEAELIFAGFGITIPANDPKVTYDDYANIEVRGKIVVVLTGDPAVGNSSSHFREQEYSSFSNVPYKINNAIQHGAKGFILIRNPLSLNNPNQESNLFFNATEGGGTRFPIVAGLAKIAWINQILIRAKKVLTRNHKNLSNINSRNSLLEIQKEISAQQRPNSFLISPVKATMTVNLIKRTGQVANVMGYLPANNPQLASNTQKSRAQEWIVLGAHMDHLGYGGIASMDPDQVGQVHPGADDNASGCTLLLDLARNLALKNDRNKNILFLFFNAEEVGLLGSQHFVEFWQNKKGQWGNISYMLNFDMVGRYQEDLQVLGLNSAYEWPLWLEENHQKSLENQDSNWTVNYRQNSLGSSDHASFIHAKIPALFFTTGAHEDYHRVSDTFDKINYERLKQISDWTLSLVNFLNTKGVPVFNPASQTEDSSDRGKRGYGALLGCIPEFSDNNSGSTEGVTCSGIVAASPAEKAGIKKGDILVQLGDVKLVTLYDLAYSLKYYRPQDTLKLKFLRDQKPIEVLVTLASREDRK